MDKFLKGHINLTPTGQRPMLRNASNNLVHDMLFCNVAPASMLYNRNTITSVYDVSDGLQRTTKIVGAMLGIFPVKNTKGEKVYLCNPTHEKGWRALRESDLTLDVVKEYIECILKANDIDDEAEHTIVVDSELRFEFSSMSVSIQVVENWPSRAAACLAQLQTMSTTTHSIGETAYESTNALTMAMAKHEKDWMPGLIALGLGSHDKSKALFLQVLRGIACTISEIEFVNKANDVVGFGDFMSSIFYFMMNDLPEDYEQVIIVETFIPRLNEFVMYYTANVAKSNNRVKRWKPDMIATLVFMLASGEDCFPDARVMKVLKRLESPRMNNRSGFITWF